TTQTIGQDGTVALALDNDDVDNDANTIGKIDVRAGNLLLGVNDSWPANIIIGGATEIRLAAGTELRTRYSNETLNTVIKGNGTVVAGGTLTLDPSETNIAGVAPGSSGGVLTITNSLTLDSEVLGGGTAYATLYTEVVGTNTAGASLPGDDFDQLVVGGNANVANGNLEVRLGVPSINLQLQAFGKLDSGDMIIVDVDGSLTSPFNATSIGETIGTPSPDNHWVGTGDLVDYVGSDVVLNGDGANYLSWTAVAGDITLDDKVNITDLGALATNWQATLKPGGGVVDWLNGDFTQDGVVNITDLGALATNWQYGVGGIEAVPEPMTLALLAIGGVALLRRRRR
ncbi:hypothetical protein LCGC14_3043400, partial [marine sediment metagenome]